MTITPQVLGAIQRVIVEQIYSKAKIFETAEDVTYLFELFNMIVEELITRPKKLGELYTRIPESQRKRVEKQK